MSDMTIEQWHEELCRLAEAQGWPVCDYPDEYFDAWQDGTTPEEYLEMEMSYGE